MMKLDVETSKTLKILSLLAMVLVIYIHSINIYDSNAQVLLPYEDNSLNYIVVFVQLFFSDGVAKIAVPTFFIISGYLFFMNLSNMQDIYISKMPKRIGTLVVPYLFWSGLVIGVFILMQAVPYSSQFFNGKHIIDYSGGELISSLLLTPLNYPLWFLRDLIIVVFIFSPIIYLLLKYIPKIYLLIVFVTWLSGIEQTESYIWIFRLTAILFFSIGGYLSMYQVRLNQTISKKTITYLWILFLLILLVKTIIHMETINENYFLVKLLLKFDIFIGIVLFWYFAQKLPENKTINKLIPFTFLFFVFQEPFITIAKKLGFYVLGYNAYSSLFIYISIPILAIIFLTFLGRGMQKYFPITSKIITGNRL